MSAAPEGRAQVARAWPAVSGVHLEGVIWDAAAGRLLLVDIPRGHVFEVTPEAHGDPDGATDAGDTTGAAGATGTDGVRRLDLPAPVTAVHPTTEPGTLLVADGDGMALVRQGDGGGSGDLEVERLADPLAGRPEIRMNDGAVGPGSRYFAGSMDYDATTGAACLYRLDPDRSLHTVLTDLTISNGIDWSPDGTLCYFIDSPLRRVDVFDHDPVTGALTGRRPFADTSGIPGVPDGLTVDADGSVWVAFFGGSRVTCFAPDGGVETTIEVPVSQVTSCCFGGEDLSTLYISTSTEGLSEAERARQPDAGSLFVAHPGRRGRPATPFTV